VPEPPARVICLHGAFSGGATWDALRARLTADGHRVETPDLRGHGDGPRGSDRSLRAFRDDVLALIGDDEVLLVGHSLGAHVATLVALAVPGQIRRLVLEEPPMPPVPPTRRTALHLVAARLRGRRFDPRTAWAAIRALRRPAPAWAAAVVGLPMPTLVIAGGAESHIPQRRIADLAARLPQGELLELPVGHRVHRAAPEAYADAVAAFLAASRR
jgi:pimeloyl-ACP methyl ester carboxylesterase